VFNRCCSAAFRTFSVSGVKALVSSAIVGLRVLVFRILRFVLTIGKLSSCAGSSAVLGFGGLCHARIECSVFNPIMWRHLDFYLMVYVRLNLREILVCICLVKA
jgi:hypothetical protein